MQRESGQTLVARLLPDTDPIHKVTIIPHGMALGITQQLPEDDRYFYPRSYLENRICVALGGGPPSGWSSVKYPPVLRVI